MMKYFMLTAFTVAGLVVVSGCASSPMKDRLERNLVYQCTLQMLEKNVNAADAEKVCSSAHSAEMTEREFSANQRASRASRRRAPASTPTQGGSASQVESHAQAPAEVPSVE